MPTIQDSGIWPLSRIKLINVSPDKRICVFEQSIMTNFNCACPAIQRDHGSGFLSEGSSWLTACMSEQRRFWRDCAVAQARLNLRCSHRRYQCNAVQCNVYSQEHRIRYSNVFIHFSSIPGHFPFFNFFTHVKISYSEISQFNILESKLLPSTSPSTTSLPRGLTVLKFRNLTHWSLSY